MKALIVLSGGLDSTVALADAVEKYGEEEVAAVTFTYGQKHTKEIGAARDVVDWYDIKIHEVINLPQIFEGSGSVLITVNDLEMPEKSYQEIDDDNEINISPTYVPFRNGNLLSMAATMALTIDASEVWAGMHAEDALNWAYPDCTPEFLGSMASAIYVGTYHEVRLITPHMWRTKAEVVESGFKLSAPFDLTWSCYNGEELHCGVCPTCAGRIQAFMQNGKEDMVEYQIEIDWKLE